MDATEINTTVTIASIILALITIFLARKSIYNYIKSIRPSESVAIFGPKEAGKTTMIRYLQNEPLPKQHFSTFGAQPVGKIVYDLSGNETYFFRSREMFDVGGEHHKGQWGAIIKSQNPNGIIFIVDTNEPELEKNCLRHIYTIYNGLRTNELAGNLKLKCLLILLNKCDVWGTSPEAREQKVLQYRNLFLESINLFQRTFGDNLQIQFGCSSLTNSEYTQSNNAVLRTFAMILAKKK